MGPLSEMCIPDDRFAEYVDELRDFSRSHQVLCGRPENLTELLKKFKTSHTFDAEFGSMIRSIVLREHFKPSESELLTLVAVTWGGEQTGDSTPELPLLFGELHGILETLLKSGSMGRFDPRARPVNAPEAGKGVPQNADDAIEEPEQACPDVQTGRQSLGLPHERDRPGSSQDSVSAPAPVQEHTPVTRSEMAEAIPDSRRREHPVPRMGPGLLFGAEVETTTAILPEVHDLEQVGHQAGARWLEPSLSEIVAMGLTGLVTALLFTVASLPVYRTRVSVALPAGAASAANATGDAESLARALRSGELTGEVAQRVLTETQHNPILRQDALSRGMRDLHMGGNETILYAELVAETAQQVKVTRLEPQNVYGITCDSWSSQFAATFCNELLSVLYERAAGTSGSQQGAVPVRTIDAASGPGAQVFPHWYLQGLGGLAFGCLTGASLGFIKRPPKDNGEKAEP